MCEYVNNSKLRGRKAALFLQNRNGFEGIKNFCRLPLASPFSERGISPFTPFYCLGKFLTCFRETRGLDF